MKTAATETKTALIGQATAEEILALKAANPGAYGIKVGGHIAYFRAVTRIDINEALATMNKDSPLDYEESILNACFIGGSREVIDTDHLFLGAITQLKPKINGALAEVVDL